MPPYTRFKFLPLSFDSGSLQLGIRITNQFLSLWPEARLTLILHELHAFLLPKLNFLIQRTAFLIIDCRSGHSILPGRKVPQPTVFLTVASEGWLGKCFLAWVFYKDSHPIFEILLRSVLCRLVPRNFTYFRLRALVQLEEGHIIKWIALITSPIDLEAVNLKVFWA